MQNWTPFHTLRYFVRIWKLIKGSYKPSTYTRRKMCIMHYSHISGDLTYIFPRKKYITPPKETKSVKDERYFLDHLFVQNAWCNHAQMNLKRWKIKYKGKWNKSLVVQADSSSVFGLNTTVLSNHLFLLTPFHFIILLLL